MKFIKENKKLTIEILCMIIIIPTIFLWDSPLPGYIPKDIGFAIVGYIGSIIGGFLTIYGVWWTIKDQDKKLLRQKQENEDDRLEQLSLEYKIGRAHV